jgi:hypothetical protein
LKGIAAMNDWSLAEVVRRASDLYVERFAPAKETGTTWEFPVLDMGGDFLEDPAESRVEADILSTRTR